MAHLCLRRSWDSVLSCFDMVPLSTRSIVNSHRQACLSTVGTTLTLAKSRLRVVSAPFLLLPRSHRRSFASLIFTAFLLRATFGLFVGFGISPIVREPLKRRSKLLLEVQTNYVRFYRAVSYYIQSASGLVQIPVSTVLLLCLKNSKAELLDDLLWQPTR